MDDKRYRGKLKLLIKNKFSDEVIFFRSSYHEPEVIISKVAVIQNFHDVSSKDIYLKKAADYLQQDILKYAEEVPSESIWPPTANSLLLEDRHLPESLVSFLEKLLSKTDTHHKVSPTVLRLVESYGADLIHGVTRGKTLTAKHFLLAMGLYDVTGSRMVIEVVNKLGHCINYDSVCEIATAQAEKATILASSNAILPLKPANEGAKVLTHFWVDNFDVVYSSKGGNSVNKNILYNLSSGTPIPNTIADKLVSLPSEGISMAKDFMQNRLDSRTVLFHEHIKRNIKKSDLQTKKISCSKQKEKTVAEVNRDILGVLVSYDQLSEEKIDYKEALKYPPPPPPPPFHLFL